MLKESAEFREVIKNSAISRNKQKEIFASFAPSNYDQITINFLNVLIESGRYLSTHVDFRNSKRLSILTLVTAKFSTKKRTSESSQP